MLYGDYKGYLNYTDTEYHTTIMCDNRLYGMMPEDGSVVQLLSAKPEGYNSSADMTEAIYETLKFAPGAYRSTYDLSPDAENDSEFLDWLDVFGFRSDSKIDYEAPVNTVIIPMESPGVSQYSVGNLWLPTGGGGSIYNCSSNIPFTGYTYIMALCGMSCCNWVEYPYEPTHPKHFQWNFAIYPEGYINRGIIDFGALTSEPGQLYVKRIASLSMECWQYTSGDLIGKWNVSIRLSKATNNIVNIAGGPFDGATVGPVHDTENPSTDDDDNSNKGGNGDGDNDNFPINIPSLPSRDMTSAGGLRIYTLSPSDILTLMSYLNSNAPGDAILKWWQNPIQAILSLHYLPYPLDIPTGAAAESVKVLGIDTGVSAFPAKQFQTIHFGKYELKRDSKTYLDYAPYTKVSIYLPGIGIRELNTDDVMDQRIWVVYNCDNVTGQFMAFIAVGDKEKDASVKYSFCGQVAAPFPLSQENWGNTFIAGATLAAGALAGGVAAAGSATAGAGEGAFISGAANAEAGKAALGEIGKRALNSGSSLSTLAKPTITRSGTVSGTTSLFGVRQPYLIVERPNYMPYQNLAPIKGIACGMCLKLSELKGYAVIESIHLSGIPATEGEIAEIETLLKAGVIL